jgi:hypothetical protein
VPYKTSYKNYYFDNKKAKKEQSNQSQNGLAALSWQNNHRIV